MSTCNISVDSFQAEVGDMSVIEKYEALMQSTLGENSLYTRTKETLFHQFESLQLTEKEKAGLTTEFITKFSLGMSQASMQTALSWSKEERDGPFQLALVKANTENALVTKEKTKEEICVLQKENELKCITMEATMAASIRENGRAIAYDPDNECKPVELEDAGLKFFQTKQVQADSQRIFSDTYRKSGVVQLGIDIDDNVFKGLTGNSHSKDGELAGYTAQQTANAERTRIAFEDSKRNHAANSSASMIGQMLSAEVAPADADVQRWRDAVDSLLVDHSTTSGS